MSTKNGIKCFFCEECDMAPCLVMTICTTKGVLPASCLFSKYIGSDGEIRVQKIIPRWSEASGEKLEIIDKILTGDPEPKEPGWWET